MTEDLSYFVNYYDLIKWRLYNLNERINERIKNTSHNIIIITQNNFNNQNKK